MIDDLRTEVEARARELAELAEKVEFRSDGEPVLKGTNIEVYRIAALLAGGLSVKDILEDYPSLSGDEVAVARAYAEAHPKPGRPYPRTTAKRALQSAGLRRSMRVLDAEEA